MDAEQRPRDLAADHQGCDPDGGADQTADRPAQCQSSDDLTPPLEPRGNPQGAVHQSGPQQGLQGRSHADTGRDGHGREQCSRAGRIEGGPEIGEK